MVGRAAILPIVEVIGNEMAVDPGVMQQFGERVVERLEWTPAAMQKRQPAGKHVAPRRHARQRTDIVIVVDHRAFRETVEIRRRHALATISAEHLPVQ